MDHPTAIEQFLADEFHLSKKEIAIYLNLTKHGPMTVLELSELSRINRATTHVNLDYLTKKGLVSQMRKGRGSRRLLIAEPCEKLSLILQERKTKIETAEKQLQLITEELTSLKKNAATYASGIDIRRYDGKNEVKLIYDEALKAKEIRTYVNNSDVAKTYPSNAAKFIDAHKKNKDMVLWGIMEDSITTRQYIEQMDHKRFYYRLGIIAPPSIDYLIFDGKIAMIETSQNLTGGILIQNQSIYETSKAIYNIVWTNLAEEKKPNHKI